MTRIVFQVIDCELYTRGIFDSLDEAVAAARRLRAASGGALFQVNRIPVGVTGCFGTSFDVAWSPSDHQDPSPDSSVVDEWTEFDRSGSTAARRVVVRADGSARIDAEDVVWWRCLGDGRERPDAVDPDGGPLYSVGGTLRGRNGRWRIEEITRVAGSDGDAEPDALTIEMRVVGME